MTTGEDKPEALTVAELDELERDFGTCKVKQPYTRLIAQARSALSAIAHNDHPLRHFDRTCPACIAEESLTERVGNCAGPSAATPPTKGRRHWLIANDAIELFLEYRGKHGHDEIAAKWAVRREFEEAEQAEIDSTSSAIAINEIPAEFAQIAKFYDVQDMAALVRIQSEHVERLQKQLPPLRDTEPRNPRRG